MKIKCLHGYFIFEETKVAQISDFMRYTDLEIIPVQNHFTFADLELAPEFSIKGKPIEIGTAPLPAKVDFAGEPWEVMEANGMVYNFVTQLLQPIQSVTNIVSIDDGGNRFISPGLILPGSLTAEGKRVKDYAAWFSRDTQRFLYTAVAYV